MDIYVVRKSAYGRYYTYIQDPEIAKAVFALTGRKCLNLDQQHALMVLGHRIVLVMIDGTSVEPLELK